MRPPPASAEASPGRGWRHSADTDSASLHTAVTPIECFLATESELDAAEDTSPMPALHPQARQKTSIDWSSRFGPRLPQSFLDLDTPTLAGSSGPASTISGVTSPARSSSSMSLAGRESSAVSSRGFPPSATPHGAIASSSTGGSGPQLIMPNLFVPRRRPFSETGKSLGKLKILIAGQPGTGKTSLISSIGQCCQHIVHMDSIDPSISCAATEVYASTKPHPWWRTDLDAGSSRKRRMSSTDEIIHRNICFVDCATLKTDIRTERQYVESQLIPLLGKPVNDRDLCTLLSNGAEPIVDAVLYVLQDTGPMPVDLECMKALQSMTNVIPLLARADELSSESISDAKQQLAQALAGADIKCFSFANPDVPSDIPLVFAVSNATFADPENMDASDLMSSEYIQPLVPTDLNKLTDHIFSLEGSAWLRHSAATKCVRWRQQKHPSGLMQSALSHRHLMTPAISTNPFTQSRYWDRIEVSDWAQSLRQSLASERFGSFSSQEMTMCEKSLAMAKRGTKSSRGSRRSTSYDMECLLDTRHQDPLGLLGVVAQLKHSGRFAVELLSSLGIFGYVAAWLIRSGWAYCPGLSEMPRSFFASSGLLHGI